MKQRIHDFNSRVKSILWWGKLRCAVDEVRLFRRFAKPKVVKTLKVSPSRCMFVDYRLWCWCSYRNVPFIVPSTESHRTSSNFSSTTISHGNVMHYSESTPRTTCSAGDTIGGRRLHVHLEDKSCYRDTSFYLCR